MSIVTEEQSRFRTRASFFSGAFIAALVIALVYHWLYGWTPLPVSAPEIVMQGQSRTVARIPTQHGGVRVDCTVIIDQARNIWSITC